MYSASDYQYMQQALGLARAATRRAAPNPGVGCVLVRDGQILGEGASLPAGQHHAEIQALNSCLAKGISARGATAYVTLEPCSHYGRTPPCAKRLIAEGIGRVVVALIDPYHQVAGQGIAMLQAAGIRVDVGLLADEARQVHRGFLSRVSKGRPWVLVKAAATLDGKTALTNGRSQWITSPFARQDVQRLRAGSDGILTGSGTVCADNPQMTVREPADALQPQRIVLDSRLQTDPVSHIYQGGGTWLATLDHPVAELAPYLAAGCEPITLSQRAGRADVHALMASLGERGINHLMVEAGAGLNGALLRENLVDELVLYLAPSLVGDLAQGLFAWPALTDLADKTQLKIEDVRLVGPDLRLQLRPLGNESAGVHAMR